MSSRERHRRSKIAKGLCAACQARKARFKYRRVVRADRDHTLCFECYRREVRQKTRATIQKAAVEHATYRVAESLAALVDQVESGLTPELFHACAKLLP